MPDQSYDDAINNHYTQENLAQQILTSLAQAGKDINNLTRDDLIAFEEFHVKGRAGTREMAELAGLHEGLRVLDLGCGIGGPARTLAAEYGCIVTGVDLTESYIDAARVLTERVGLSDRVDFFHGNAMNPPVPDDTYDVVWTQHLIMNIDDKARFCDEVQRVLRPGGKLVCYEAFEGAESSPYYPVPWASDDALSFVTTQDTFRELMASKGMREKAWHDVTESALEWFQKMLKSAAERKTDTLRPVGLNLLMGKDTSLRLKNVVRNMEEKRITLAYGVFEVE